jgi:hypothetical protein
MAYFAELDENNIVLRVIRVENSEVGDGSPVDSESESIGQAFIASCGISGVWKQTSFNNNFRKVYANIGFYYNQESDVFIPLQPFPSWSLDGNHDWQPPTPKPEGDFYWNEESLSWIPIPDAE